MRMRVFLPVKDDSERIPQKSYRPFAGIQGGLLEIKLKQLLKIPEIEIFLSTDSPTAMSIANSFNNSRIKIDVRPAHLCRSETLIKDLIAYIPTVLNSENILWTHVTSPFVDEKTYLEAIRLYEANIPTKRYDSMMSVNKIQQFIWCDSKKDVVNFDRSKVLWPRTQDLVPLFEINHAFYITPRSVFLESGDRVGKNPYLYLMRHPLSLDIDEMEDFKFAEAMFSSGGHDEKV